MFRITILSICLSLSAHVFAHAQSIIKVLEFDNSTGVIDRGEQDGIKVGDVFEVNRYAGDFVTWIGRVEVILVKPKIAGIKALERAANADFLKGDVLEFRKREYDPLLDKLNHPAPASSSEDTGTIKMEATARQNSAPATLQAMPLHFGVTGGFSIPLTNASKSLGQNLSLRVVDDDNDLVGTVDMTHTYAGSLAMQGYCVLPLSDRMTVNLNIAYIPLNIKDDVESALLQVSLKGSASLLTLSSSLNYRLNDRWQVGGGVGVYMPKLTVSGGGHSLTVSDRHFGFAVDLSHFLRLSSRVMLRSVLVYSVFLDDGPAIHAVSLQAGPSFAIGKQ